MTSQLRKFVLMRWPRSASRQVALLARMESRLEQATAKNPLADDAWERLAELRAVFDRDAAAVAAAEKAVALSPGTSSHHRAFALVPTRQAEGLGIGPSRWCASPERWIVRSGVGVGETRSHASSAVFSGRGRQRHGVAGDERLTDASPHLQ